MELSDAGGWALMTSRAFATTVLAVAAFAVLASGCSESPTPPDAEPDASSLAFVVQPAGVQLGIPLEPAPAVAVRDATGATVTSSTLAVTLSLTGASGSGGLAGTLTVNAEGGVATFDNVWLDLPGAELVFQASAAGLAAGSSNAFAVPLRFTAVEAGSEHSCGGTHAGIFCWGSNSSGQLGAPVDFRAREPTRITQPEGAFVKVAAGSYHSCALRAEGAIQCWGANTFGSLGDGSTVDRAEATSVSTPGEIVFRALAAGSNHTCAIGDDGSVWCWGRNDRGQLGTGATDYSLDPHPVPEAVALPEGVTFDSIAAGGDHTCGLTAGGDIYCWGNNLSGQLGNGDEAAGTGGVVVEPAPVPIAGPPEKTFAAVSAGRSHTCAVTTEGEGWCWGLSDFFGNLGDGSTGLSARPVLVAAPPGVVFKQIHAGGDATCGLSLDGAAWCWGRNGSGGLGTDDGAPYHRTPAPVAMPPAATFVRVAVGADHACGLGTDARAWCWGANTHGKLGDGSLENRPRPVSVAGQ